MGYLMYTALKDSHEDSEKVLLLPTHSQIPHHEPNLGFNKRAGSGDSFLQ